MHNISAIFAPVIGKCAWQIRKGIGSFISMEFGEPHLEIREPVTTTSSHGKADHQLRRRAVYVHGEWHFWIQYAAWSLELPDYPLVHGGDEDFAIESILKEFDGQRLTRVSVLNDNINLDFDLGAKLIISKSEETEGYDPVCELFGPKNYLAMVTSSESNGFTVRHGKSDEPFK